MSVEQNIIAELEVDRNSTPEGLQGIFRVQKGDLTSKQIEQLVHYSTTDPVILKYGPSDHEMFNSVERYRAWIKEKPRYMYALTNRNEDLYGILWYEYLPLPENLNYIDNFDHNDYPVTFGLGLYGEARKKGLAFPFFLKASEDFLLTHPVKFWVSTKVDNEAVLAMLHASPGTKQVVNEPDYKNLVYFTMDPSVTVPATRNHITRRTARK